MPIGIRASGAVLALVEAEEAQGETRAGVVTSCLELVVAAREVLGDDWYELEKRARVEGIPLGAYLGRLLQTATRPRRP